MDKPILIVKNFLNIEDVELELSKINVIIGRQATGKSILAKLVFFFQSCFLDSVNYAINPRSKDINEADVDQDVAQIYIGKFYRIFPQYAWQNQSFTIIYKEGNFQTVLELKIDKNSHELKIDYSYHFREAINSIKKSQERSTVSMIDFIMNIHEEFIKKT